MDFPALIPKLFIASAALALLSCLARPDFNLPLFVFAWLIWSDPDKVKSTQKERVKLLGFIVFTGIVDLIWLCYWGPSWNSASQYEQWEHGVHSFVLFISSINFILKLVIIALIYLVERANVNESLPQQVVQMLPRTS
jgi:hypothetical protein